MNRSCASRTSGETPESGNPEYLAASLMLPPDRDIRSLAVDSGRKALENAGLTPAQVEAFYLGNFAGPSFVGQSHLAPFIAGPMGITGVPCTRIEAACASSGSAFFHAFSAVAAGLYDAVLVTRGEKIT